MQKGRQAAGLCKRGVKEALGHSGELSQAKQRAHQPNSLPSIALAENLPDTMDSLLETGNASRNPSS